MKDGVFYSDINSKYEIDNGQRAILENAKDVISSLDRLLNTRKGSVPFNREYGCSIHNMIFENKNPNIASAMELSLYDDITTQEPRVVISNSSIKVDINTADNIVTVQVYVIMPQFNNYTDVVETTINFS
jgi:phage baseplate assembly protein W